MEKGGTLFRRDFAVERLNIYKGLRLVDCGFVTGVVRIVDLMTWVLMEKAPSPE